MCSSDLPKTPKPLELEPKFIFITFISRKLHLILLASVDSEVLKSTWSNIVHLLTLETKILGVNSVWISVLGASKSLDLVLSFHGFGD